MDPRSGAQAMVTVSPARTKGTSRPRSSHRMTRPGQGPPIPVPTGGRRVGGVGVVVGVDLGVDLGVVGKAKSMRYEVHNDHKIRSVR